MPADKHHLETIEAEPVIRAIVPTKTVLGNAVTVVTAALLPGAVLGLPATCTISLPRHLLFARTAWAPLLCGPVVLLLALLPLLILPPSDLLLLSVSILLLRALLLLTLLILLAPGLLLALLPLLVLLPSGPLLLCVSVLLLRVLLLLTLLILLALGLLLLVGLLPLFPLAVLFLFWGLIVLFLLPLPCVRGSNGSEK